jgi:hypothetical protein
MKKTILNDSFRVSDSKVKGYVVIKQDGKIILRKENMIVENGRKYIKNLVLSKITETRKINSIKFGTGTAPVSSNNTSLQTVISEYDLNITSLAWEEYTETDYSSGSNNPNPVIVGDYFYNTSSNELLIGISGTPSDTWTEAENYTIGTLLPTSGTENHLFYNTQTNKLYIYSKKLFTIDELQGNEIGLKITAHLIGTTNVQSISELGLFFDTNRSVVADENFIIGKSYEIKDLGEDTSAWAEVETVATPIFGDSTIEEALTGMETGDLFVLTGEDPAYTLREYDGEA